MRMRDACVSSVDRYDDMMKYATHLGLVNIRICGWGGGGWLLSNQIGVYSFHLGRKRGRTVLQRHRASEKDDEGR